MDRFKTYRVFLSKKIHDTNFYEDNRNDIISRTDIFVYMVNDEYEFCADISARDLNEVYKLTQNIDNTWVSGENTNAVQPQYTRGARSTAIGDIFRDCESGDYYVVIPHGFESLSFAPEKSKESADVFYES